MTNPSENAIKELKILYPRVQNPAAAKRLWEQILSPKERKKLGGTLAKSYDEAKGGTAYIWSRLHRGTGERAIVEAAYRLGFIHDSKREWLLRELGETVPRNHEPNDRPVWDKERRELRFRGAVVRKVPRPNAARNVVKVLDAFEEEGWPSRIDSPLPNAKDHQRLHATVRSINDGIVRNRIKFSADGTGEGFIWRC
jgi:hypothetical protein